ncbi:hypothetical protein Hypma_016486 [Hypsizygus marmoreus]|uniref:Uncharacterized protein n=1 Tax=Hypsizygus marmoreus TaxID=39966 RepID=A0A369J187_HYPMA|nr:hypothetical protein Hypma_016486 [Hypsizygus marmoreus]
MLCRTLSLQACLLEMTTDRFEDLETLLYLRLLCMVSLKLLELAGPTMISPLATSLTRNVTSNPRGPCILLHSDDIQFTTWKTTDRGLANMVASRWSRATPLTDLPTSLQHTTGGSLELKTTNSMLHISSASLEKGLTFLGCAHVFTHNPEYHGGTSQLNIESNPRTQENTNTIILLLSM